MSRFLRENLLVESHCVFILLAALLFVLFNASVFLFVLTAEVSFLIGKRDNEVSPDVHLATLGETQHEILFIPSAERGQLHSSFIHFADLTRTAFEVVWLEPNHLRHIDLNRE